MERLFLSFTKYFLLVSLLFFLLQVFHFIGGFFDEGEFFYALKATPLLVLSSGTMIFLFGAFCGLMLTAKRFKGKVSSKTLKVFCVLIAVLFSIIAYSYSNFVAPKIHLHSVMVRYVQSMGEEPSPETFEKRKKNIGQNPKFQTFMQIGFSIDSVAKEKLLAEKSFLERKKRYSNRENQSNIIQSLKDSHDRYLELIDEEIREYRFERHERIINAIGAMYFVFLGFFLGLKFSSQKNVSLLAMAFVAFSVYLGFLGSLEKSYVDQMDSFGTYFCLVLLVAVFGYAIFPGKPKIRRNG